MRLFYLFILGIVVALFLLFRKWVDQKRERLLDIEIVRDGEEHLGSWANRTGRMMTFFRLHRNGSFTAKRVINERKDTLITKGSYDIIGAGNGRSTDYYPRLVAVDEKNDTLFNCFIAYITPYDSKTEKVDKLVLNPNSIYDTAGQTFYRIKQ